MRICAEQSEYRDSEIVKVENSISLPDPNNSVVHEIDVLLVERGIEIAESVDLICGFVCV